MRVCSTVQSIEELDDQIAINTDGAQIRVQFVTDDIIRIRTGFDGDFAEESYSLVMTAWPDRLDEIGRAHV